MKRKFIICGLFLSGSLFFSLTIRAQQQKKPSERSFTTEINKLKQIQAERNIKNREIQQPADNTVVVRDKKPATTSTLAQKQPISPATKPSAGQMKQPAKPVIPNK